MMPGSSIQVSTGRSTQKPIGTIAIPARDHVNVATVTSLLHTDWSFLEGEALDRLILQGSVLTLQRNEAIQRMRGDFLLFIDDDMTWAPDAIGKLVRSWREISAEWVEPVIMGGLCFRRSAPFQPTLYMRERPDSGAYNFLEHWDADVVEVDATGCAFLLIPQTAFEAIAGCPQPPYEVRQTLSRLPSFFRWEGSLGEDLRFCQDAKAAGVKIFVDTRIAIGHVGEVVIGKEDFLRSIALRSPDIEEERKRVNDAMGLPTLTRQEARDELGW